MEARGIFDLPSRMWVARFISYCKEHFARDDPTLKMIKRIPRTREQQRAGAQPLEIAKYFYQMKKVLESKPRAIMFCDEAGWSGFYGGDLKGVECLALEMYRNEVYRYASGAREHITIFPPVLVILDDKGEIESIHHMGPLFVYPRKYTSTKFAESTLDPANQRTDDPIVFRKRGAKAFAKSPRGIPAPTEFPRYAASSDSGNVNSTIVYNHFKDNVIPWMRGLGVSKQDRTVLNWDRHGSHAHQPLLTLQESENLEGIYFPSHTTNWVQLQDADRGQFSVLKRESRKDIDAWNAHLFRQNQHLALEDFPFVLQNAYQQSINEEVTRKALRRIGLFPFDPDKVLGRMPNSDSFSEYTQQFIDDEKANLAKASVEVEAAEGTKTPTITQSKFFQTASDPRHYRSPKQRLGPRLHQDPNLVFFSGEFDVFDFDAQERLREIKGLVHKHQVVPSAGAKKKPRGSRMGKPGDVFLAVDVTKQRNKFAKAQAEKKTKTGNCKKQESCADQRLEHSRENPQS